MLPGVKVRDITKFPDERGSFAEIFRDDWKDLLKVTKLFKPIYRIPFLV